MEVIGKSNANCDFGAGVCDVQKKIPWHDHVSKFKAVFNNQVAIRNKTDKGLV